MADNLGFKLVLTEEQKKIVAANETYAARRAPKWQNFLAANPDLSAIRHSSQLKRYVRKGIPHSMRPQVWFTLSGAESRCRHQPELYNRVVTEAFAHKAKIDEATRAREAAGQERPEKLEPDYFDQVEKDLHRTFPENSLFCGEEGEPEKDSIKQMRRVLYAFAEYNKDVGYCQGMNYITGLLLLVMQSEEKAFWMLVAMTEYRIPRYYDETLTAVRVEQDVLLLLVRDELPRVSQHMKEKGMPSLTMLSIKWFITIFIDVLPLHTTLRVWDAFLSEGVKILFRVSLAILQLNESKILACNDGHVMFTLVKDLPASMHDADLLLDTAFNKLPRSLPMNIVNQYRLDCEVKLDEQNVARHK